MTPILRFSIACLLAITPLAMGQQSGTQTPCYNGYDPGHFCVDCTGKKQWVPSATVCPGGGVNPVNVASSDVQRVIQDVSVFGGVGGHRLNWTRYGHSRLVSGNRPFGDGHQWRHSYQWEVVSTGAGSLKIIEPEGSSYNYNLSDGVWTGIASNDRKLTQDGDDYYLTRANGETYHFHQFSVDGQSWFQLQDFTDGMGQTYNLTYDANHRLVRVMEPAGHWLKITYSDVTVNAQEFSLLGYAQDNPPEAQWSEVTVANSGTFRYLRYYSTEPGDVPSYSDIAEIEFYDTNGVKLSGTPFGTAPWQGDSSWNFSKAFDGDVNTFYSAYGPHFGFVGLDLGAGNEKAIGKVRFYPRIGFASHISGVNAEGFPRGCRFEGSNKLPVTETVITRVEAGYGNGTEAVVTQAADYHYTPLNDTVLDSAWLTLSSVDYGDGAQASYSYQVKYPGQRPLLEIADDPRIQGNATKIKYEFWDDTYLYGAIYAERRVSDGAILAKFEGCDADGWEGRKVTYANGAVDIFSIGLDHLVMAKTDALGRTERYGYDGGYGFLAASQDPLERDTFYTRDAQGRLLGVTFPDGATRFWTRDDLGYELTSTDELGHTTTTTRDTFHRPTRMDSPDGSYETFTYNTLGQVEDHRMRNGGTEHNAYGSRGLLTSQTDALGNVTTYIYNAKDLVSSVTDPLNHTTSYEYNDRGQVTKVTYADGAFATYVYDAYGNRTATINELGNTWTTTFDEFKRKLTSTDPLSRTTHYGYDEQPGGGCGCGFGGAGSHLTTIVLPSGKTTKYTYDAVWQKTSETVGFGTAEAATTSYDYDAAGQMVAMTDPNGKVWTHTYDSRNRTLTSSDPLGNTTAWTYDSRGNNLTVTRPDGGVTTNTYDAMNRVVSTTDPANQTTAYAYGGIAYGDGSKGDNLVRMTDACNNSYDFTYDLEGRKTSMIYPPATSGGTRSHEDWTYDEVGNVATYTTRAGQVKTCTHDSRNRDTICDWSDSTPDVNRSYDVAGRLLTLNNGVSSITYTYDDANQMLSEMQDIAGASMGAKTLSYTYDLDGNRATLTYPGGKVVDYHYTARHQTDFINYDGAPPIVEFGYDLAGNRVSKAFENGAGTVFGYDDASRLNLINHTLTINGQTANMVYAYGINTVGNRTDRTETIAGVAKRDHYSYTADDQINTVRYNWSESAATQDRLVDYQHDAVGNRSTVTDNGSATSYAVNGLNQYSANGTVTAPVYDANGNLTRIQNANGEPAWNYTYDAANRLVSGSNGITSFQFAYDAKNRCTTRIINGASTFQLFDNWSLVAEYDTSGSEQRRYINGTNVDDILAAVSPAGIYFYHSDSLGNTVALSDQSGALIERVSYDVFGTPTIASAFGNTLAQSSAGNRFLFNGREWLPELGLYDYRNRIFSPNLGRFLQIDPLRFDAKDVNMNRYVENNVTNLRDPFGLMGAGDYRNIMALAILALPPQYKSCLGSCHKTEQGCRDCCGLVSSEGGLLIAGAYAACNASAISNPLLGFTACKVGLVKSLKTLNKWDNACRAACKAKKPCPDGGECFGDPSQFNESAL